MYGSITAPVALVVDDEPLQRAFARQVLGSAGWDTITAEGVVEACAALSSPVHLVLLDLHFRAFDAVEALARLRLRPDAAAVPVVAYTTTRLRDAAPLLVRGFDDVLAKPCSPEELIACAERWRPPAAQPAAARLRQTFGRRQMDDLLGRFQMLLVEALAALVSGDAAALAHRVAGIAGTLGFPDLGRAWLDHSEGRGDVRDLNRATRLAIGELDRLRENGR